MLSKPGEARTKSATPTQRRRKVVEENQDDIVRRLQRLPPNKACADCSAKMTQCVNLTHGTFVCMACSGVHREFNHKIKGIGHSSFTKEEVAQLRHASSGNEAVNSHYLARYTSSDRMKPPRNNNDLQHLRSWIQQKYIDKYWCEDKEGGNNGGGRTGSSSATKSSSSGSGRSSKSKSKSESSRRKIMPTVNEKQSKPASNQPTAPSPAPDPFGFDSIVSNSTTAASTSSNNTSWDAFGGSTQNNAAASSFQADFGNMNSPAPAATVVSLPVAAPPPPAAAPAPGFQANFGNFNQLPPAGQPMPPTQQPPQQHQAAQPAFQATFGQAHNMANQTPVQQIQPQQQVQQHQPNQMQGGFANFGSMQPQQQPQIQQHQQMQMQMQQPQQQPQMQHPQQQMQQPQQNVQNNQQGFGNFGSMQPQQQQQQQQNQFPQQQPGQQLQMGQPQNNMQMQGAGMANQQPNEGDMNNLGQPQQQPGNMQPSQPPQTTQMQGSGMGNQQGGMNFGQFSQQQPQMQQQQSINPSNVSHMHQQNSNLQSNDQSDFANLSSVQPQQQMQAQQQNHTLNQPPSNVQMQAQHQNVPSQGAGGGSMNQPGPVHMSQPPQQQNSMSSQSTGTEPPTGVTKEQPPATGASTQEVPPPPAPSFGQMQSESDHSGSAAMNPNAFRSGDDDKKSAFDAFDGLSVEPTPAAYMAGGDAPAAATSEGVSSHPTSSDTNKNPKPAPYHEGQKVVYSNSEGSCLAIVTKVHFDDELQPYYSINLNGREKQTDSAHLSLPGESSNQSAVSDPSANSAASRGNGAPMLLQETASMLQMLNAQQLMHIKQLVSSMISGNNQPGAGQTPQMSFDHRTSSLGSVDSGFSVGNNHTAAPMGGAPPPAPTQAPAAAQFSMHPNQGMQAQSIGMSTNVSAPSPPVAPPPAMPPPAAPAPTQFSMQSMGMGMNTSAVAAPAPPPPSGMPPPPPPAQPPAPPNQFSMQQQPTHGIPQQAMGMGAPVAPSPAAMPPPPPANHQAPAQFSMNGGVAQQLPSGMGASNSNGFPPAPPAPVAPAPALPPVEKEGNPFDFY